ncbi:MAG TPA: phosphatase PAP2 family protein [Candidatus Paceibacterota bacterium]|nr:phosphatase PAP2 family protein [Candidatus Paceibacterota bacterium]
MEQVLQNKFARELAVGLILMAIVSAIVLAALVSREPIMLTDVTISREIQEDVGRGPLPVMEFISLFGTPAVAAATVIFFAAGFAVLRHRREALFVLLTPLASLANVLIKLVVNRPRPTPAAVIVYEQLKDASFPSGHVVFYVVLFGFLAAIMIVQHRLPRFLRIIVGTVSLGLIVGVSVSRIYLGAHWLTDVIGGYLVGFVFLSVYLRFYFSNFRAEPQKKDV